MGEGAPDDQRDSHGSEASDWREAGDRRGQGEMPRGGNRAQMGYGNARDAEGMSEHDRAAA